MDSIQLKTKELKSKMYLTQTHRLIGLIKASLGNLVPIADFVRFRFDFTEQSTLETTPGIDQFDWLISFQCLS